jgi:hypothetical protein
MRLFAFHRKSARDAGVPSRGVAASGGLIFSDRARAHGVQEKRRQAVDAGGVVLAAIASELARGTRSQLETSWQRLECLFDIVQLSDECLRLLAAAEVEPVAHPAPPAVPEYDVSSWFLAECAAYLLSDPRRFELLHLTTGIEIREGQRTLDRMVRVGLAEQSETHAVANQHELQRLLIECSERWGHSLHGLFHSHPGAGPLATRPSSKDLATHERYERGYPVVGAIFARDGEGAWVRFFGHRPFTIRLYGKGVYQHETHLFKITDLPRHLSMPDAFAAPAGRGERDRPAGESAGVHSAGARAG